MIDVKVGIPREVKNNEFRVAITPAGVHELVRHGHQVLVERHAGEGSSIPDAEYVAAGAQILPTADEVWAAADLLLKVKEPVAEEYHRLRKGQTLFTYLHLAASRACTDALLESGTTAIAYETVETATRALPLLAPMSEVAGRLAPQVGAYHLMRSVGGRGVLPGGVPGTGSARAVVIGGGVSGWNATQIAVGLGFHVTLLDKDINKLREADKVFGTKVRTVVSNALELEKAVVEADLVVGAVLIPGAKAPKLVTNELVARMKPGSVLVDIAIDQEAASRTRIRRRTPSRPSRSTTRSSTASRTCRVRCRTPPPTRSPTPRCPTSWSSRTGAGSRPCAATPRSPRVSTPMTARWFTARSPRRTVSTTSN